MLELIIKLLDMRDKVVPLIHYLGDRHRAMQVRREYYAPFGEALIATLGAFLGDKFTPELRRAWTQAYRYMADNMPQEGKVDWRLSFPFRRPAPCFHGGAFFEAIGPKFDQLERRHDIINADVLDAWFPPSPKVLAALQDHLPWLLRTSPPTACEGLVEAIAHARGVAPANILPGGGSSDLIFRALRHWLTPASHALILDPTYGEYAHVLEQVIGCTVDRLPLSPRDDFAVDLDRLEAAMGDGYDLVVLVNPNSPTGRHLSRTELQTVIAAAPPTTKAGRSEWLCTLGLPMPLPHKNNE